MATCGELATALGVPVATLPKWLPSDVPFTPEWCLCGVIIDRAAMAAGFDAKLNDTFDTWTLTRKAEPCSPC
jgi:hypothetical protein